MKSISKFVLSLFMMLVISQEIFAQTAEEHPQSKIEIVIGVIVIIFTLIVLYLLRLEKKIKALEKKHKEVSQ
ncbi:MAG: hypothetical protein M0R38_03650 [Bacteroidia bacterium]|nr:hypothetical protein [Bacteroidia bacterium]